MDEQTKQQLAQIIGREKVENLCKVLEVRKAEYEQQQNRNNNRT